MMTALRRMMIVLACTLVLPGLAWAEDTKLGDLTITNPWTRASAGPNGGAFLTITNHGTTPDTLVSVASPGVDKVEVHVTTHDQDVMKMHAVDGIEVAPGATVTLQPGGYHVMMMGLKQPLKEGDKLPLTLTFAKAGTVQVQAEVKPAGAGTMTMQPGMHMP